MSSHEVSSHEMAFHETSAPETSAHDMFHETSAPKTSVHNMFHETSAPETSVHDMFHETSAPKTSVHNMFHETSAPEEEQAMTLLDHLGGSARDEVLCHPLSVRQDLASLTTLLRVRFGPPESIASLNAAFHSRCQLEGESLAEYSRVLMRIHDRMEQSAASLVES